ncbi:hypothetical protein B296_00017940 [Ensete ventricosum]|uniref:Uncharacterized protein n=1 Tax=Ensete ventricosum TaxID=4639 RepID=A0A427B4F8_ENSVE|nr:hypothetical protein B296_00017940 [Ensete ventricosum]
MSGAYAIHFQRTIELFDPLRCGAHYVWQCWVGGGGRYDYVDMLGCAHSYTLGWYVGHTIYTYYSSVSKRGLKQLRCRPGGGAVEHGRTVGSVTHYISRRLKVTEKEKIRIRGKSKRKIRDDPRQRSSRKRE